MVLVTISPMYLFITPKVRAYNLCNDLGRNLTVMYIAQCTVNLQYIVLT